MKNKNSHLRDHMFAALERLGEEDITDEKLKIEIARSQAIAEVGKVVVESLKAEILFARLTGGSKNGEAAKFLENPEDEVEEAQHKMLERPKAEYSNPPYNSI